MTTSSHKPKRNPHSTFAFPQIVPVAPPRLLAALAVVLLSIPAIAAQPRFVPGRLLVRPKPGVSETQLLSKLNHKAYVRGHVLRSANIGVVAVPELQAESMLARLRVDPDIEFAERDYLAQAAAVPNDPYLLSGAAWHLPHVQAAQAWDYTAGNPNIIVAVLDSGVNASHPDLTPQILQGYDFVNNNSNPLDDFGHGTAVSGVIAATGNNALGAAGLAYGARLLPVKVMNASGFASYSAIAQAIKYAVDQGARVINISIVGNAPSATLQEAIDYAWSNNVIVVAAAGNEGNDTPQYPAACNHVIGVSATAADDSLAWFSSYGWSVTLSAPGDTIWTTQRELTRPFGAWRGTSLASPIVAGIAALAISANSSLSNSQLVAVLQQSALDLGPAGYDNAFGYGRVDAYRAVLAASMEPGGLTPSSQLGPSVAMTSPADATRFAVDDLVSLGARATLRAGATAITNLTFLVNHQPVANFDSAPYEWDWSPAWPGKYTIQAVANDNRGFCSTSSPVWIEVVSPDTTLPVVTITSGPANRSRLTSPEIVLAGRASDDSELDKVEWQLNGGQPQAAQGTANWSARVLLAPGKNVLVIRSLDTSGNISATATRTFTFVVHSTLTLQMEGDGRVYPNLNGKLLEVGRVYKIHAVPGRDQAFAGWTSVPSQSPVLSFVMRSNLTLTASFVPSPFPNVRGSYAGLLANTNGVWPDNSGFVRLLITRSGLFTGKLFVGGKGHGFHGRFNLAGNASATLKRPRQNPLALRLQVDVTRSTDTLTGTAGDGHWVSDILADRNVFNARTNPALQAGSSAFVLQELENPSFTAASGITLITRSGRTRIGGRLADQRRFNTFSSLARNGDCPLYLAFNRGTEIVIGWLNFPLAPAPEANGTVLWIRGGTNAFAATLRAAHAMN